MSLLPVRAPSANSFGVYVHVPYCKHVCPYCDFNVQLVRRADWSGLGRALEAELDARVELYRGCTVESVYFGGGTPSLAAPELLARLLDALRARLPVAAEPEITLEVEPRTLDAPALSRLRELGVNRVSLGWQSTHDRLLRVLGRGHDANESREAFKAAREAGFDNVSIDLIFAVPTETLADLERDLDAIEHLAPEHVSLYALTYHEGTPYERWRASGRLVPIDEELELAMMMRIEARLTAMGYEHYEVSNYARVGRRAHHNQIYWRGGQYLGLGPGAHSFLREGWQRGWRWEGRRDVRAYIEAWQRGGDVGLPAQGASVVEWVEALSARQLLCERLLLGLRTSDGVDVATLEVGDAKADIERAARLAESYGWLLCEGSLLRPTSAGLANADALAALFF